MTASFLLKGILIGLLFGIPVGAVGTMAAQRAFSHGFGAGLKTGLGSSAADCLYAVCGAFGLTFVSDFGNGAALDFEKEGEDRFGRTDRRWNQDVFILLCSRQGKQ